MGNYGCPTPKPHYLYSNSPAALGLWNGKLKPGVRASSKASKKARSNTTKRYIDKNGKPCWTGTRHLKNTEPLDFTIIKSFLDPIFQQCSRVELSLESSCMEGIKLEGVVAMFFLYVGRVDVLWHNSSTSG